MTKELIALIDKISHAASYAADDNESIRLARLANRLQYAGAVCEKPLTKTELAEIQKFL